MSIKGDEFVNLNGEPEKINVVLREEETGASVEVLPSATQGVSNGRAAQSGEGKTVREACDGQAAPMVCNGRAALELRDGMPEAAASILEASIALGAARGVPMGLGAA
ncbi:unnamed protein product [Ilex paraguariensis]|uniref:Uncharacterized protein n=1 Tax=Ilex paraguariensis TaxID=185542 RepID=A0ABC8RSH2_9AQUA